MKRSATVSIALTTSVSIWALTLSGCERKAAGPEAAYKTVAECTAAGKPLAQCQAAAASLPRFANQATCEQQYGWGNCDQRNGGFSPAMMGFMLGQAMSGGGYYPGSSRYFTDYDYDHDPYRRRDQNRARFYGGAYARSGGLVYRQPGFVNPSARTYNTGYGARAFSSTTVRGGFGGTAHASGGGA
jgi:uncharacterized protein YgiB involved in biofilm formation